MKHKFLKRNADYTYLKLKLYFRLISMAFISFIIVLFLYVLIWFRNAGDWITSIFQLTLKVDYQNAINLYRQIFRNNSNIIWIISVATIFIIMLRVILNWIATYFDMINRGIDALLSDDAEIHLPPEMSAMERKLNEVKTELKQRALEAQLADQCKNDMIMYLAHDIRTPLTSVIGYLNLMSEVPDMPEEQRVKYMDITLDKAYRLEKMINEFFEITRCNLQQIHISKENVDLYYMLVQLSDEFSSVLSANGNVAILKANENLTVDGDPDKLARVFNNILKNAVTYSLPDTEILIFAEEKNDMVDISFINKGNTIPKEKLSTIFEKFYRLDESRSSNTGGAGLGLAIAKEIISLHGGTLTAVSEDDTITFTVTLPKGN